MPTDPDASLVRRARGGDRKAFAMLLEHNYDRMRRIAWRISGSCDDAEDIVQEICCTLADKIDGFRFEAKFSTWLAGITINAARDHLRRQKSKNNTSAGYAQVVALQSGPDGRDLYRATWLASALGRLDASLRETVILIAGEGLSHAEAAQQLGVAEGTIAWRMHEARKALRNEGVTEMAHGD